MANVRDPFNFQWTINEYKKKERVFAGTYFFLRMKSFCVIKNICDECEKGRKMCNKHELFLFCCCGFYTRHATTYNANNTAFFLRLPLCFFLLLLRRNQMYTIVLSEAILTTTIATTVAAKTFVRLANALRLHLLFPINSSFSWYIWRFFPPIHKFYGKCDFHCHYHQLSMYQIRQYVHSNQTVREWDLFFWI